MAKVNPPPPDMTEPGRDPLLNIDSKEATRH